FAQATRIIHVHTNPHNAATLVQFHGREAVVASPPDLPLTEAEMDRVYDLPYTRRPHPSYTEPIPAFEMIKDSVTIMRGCFGGCTFCSITAHQGRIIQSRSEDSILREVRQLGADPSFHGVVSDIGGPTANMYQMRCTRPDGEAKCKRLSCPHPTVPDPVQRPSNVNVAGFSPPFKQASHQAARPTQALVPYYIASHPGSDLHAMIDLAVFLKRNGYRPDQVQDFIPAPFDIATALYYTGIDPFTKEEVYVAKNMRDRRMQRALMQFFKPANYSQV